MIMKIIALIGISLIGLISSIAILSLYMGTVSPMLARFVVLTDEVVEIEFNIHASKGNIVRVEISVPEGFKLINLHNPWELEHKGSFPSSFNLVLTETVPKGSSINLKISVRAPSLPGIYTWSMIVYYSNGRDISKAISSQLPLSCLFCNTPCGLWDNMYVTIHVIG